MPQGALVPPEVLSLIEIISLSLHINVTISPAGFRLHA